MIDIEPDESNSETDGYKDYSNGDDQRSQDKPSAIEIIEQQSRLVEAVLFLEPEPQNIKTLSRLTGIPVRDLPLVIEKVQSRFSEVAHGVQLIEVAGGYILVPKPELWDDLSLHYSSLTKSKLSRAAIETLAIIAYSQPITRSEIESIRGVSSDTLIRSLYERNLITDMGRKDAPGRPIQYGTSTEFLRFFGLASIADLPKLSDSDRDKFSANS